MSADEETMILCAGGWKEGCVLLCFFFFFSRRKYTFIFQCCHRFVYGNIAFSWGKWKSPSRPSAGPSYQPNSTHEPCVFTQQSSLPGFLQKQLNSVFSPVARGTEPKGFYT